jgi:hypothetical protein
VAYLTTPEPAKNQETLQPHVLYATAITPPISKAAQYTRTSYTKKPTTTETRRHLDTRINISKTYTNQIMQPHM